MNYYQQGDVLLFPVSEVAGKVVDKPLADGETTGHAHRVAVADREDVEIREDSNGTLWMSATRPVTITHEEHKAITVPAGKYRVGRVQEYDHFAEEARQVRD